MFEPSVLAAFLGHCCGARSRGPHLLALEGTEVRFAHSAPTDLEVSLLVLGGPGGSGCP